MLSVGDSNPDNILQEYLEYIPCFLSWCICIHYVLVYLHCSQALLDQVLPLAPVTLFTSRHDLPWLSCKYTVENAQSVYSAHRLCHLGICHHNAGELSCHCTQYWCRWYYRTVYSDMKVLVTKYPFTVSKQLMGHVRMKGSQLLIQDILTIHTVSLKQFPHNMCSCRTRPAMHLTLVFCWKTWCRIKLDGTTCSFSLTFLM